MQRHDLVNDFESQYIRRSLLSDYEQLAKTVSCDLQVFGLNLIEDELQQLRKLLCKHVKSLGVEVEVNPRIKTFEQLSREAGGRTDLTKRESCT